MSDEGRYCLNDIELSYLFFLAFTLVIGFGMAYDPSLMIFNSSSRIRDLSFTIVNPRFFDHWYKPTKFL